MEFYQCLLSIPDEDTWNVIDLILTFDDTGTPVVGKCLLDQTKKFFEFRRIIHSEKADCFNELEKIREAENKRKEKDNKQSIGRKPAVHSRSKIQPKK